MLKQIFGADDRTGWIEVVGGDRVSVQKSNKGISFEGISIERGATIVEFALVIPITLAFLFGTLAVAHTFLVGMRIQQAATQGAVTLNFLVGTNSAYTYAPADHSQLKLNDGDAGISAGQDEYWESETSNNGLNLEESTLHRAYVNAVLGYINVTAPDAVVPPPSDRDGPSFKNAALTMEPRLINDSEAGITFVEFRSTSSLMTNFARFIGLGDSEKLFVARARVNYSGLAAEDAAIPDEDGVLRFPSSSLAAEGFNPPRTGIGEGR